MLDKPLSTIFRLTDKHKKALARLSILTARDLLYYFPVRYGDYSKLSYIKDVSKGETPILYAEVTKIQAKKAWKTKMTMTEATLQEASGDTIRAVWYSQPYISKMLPVGTQARFVGTINERGGSLYLANPEFDLVAEIPVEKSGDLFADDKQELMLYPVYRETRGLTSKWIYHKVKKLIADGYLNELDETLPKDLLQKYNLPSVTSAIVYMHAPKKVSDADAARKRFAFEEVFMIQLVKQEQKALYEQSGAFMVNPDKALLKKFTDSLGFELTGGQKEAVDHILKDIGSDIPMSRLLEGDVGSGKTVVAALAAYATATTKPKGQSFGKLQVGYMAPTEILAKQIFTDFVELLGQHGITVGLITGKDCFKYPSKTSDGPTKISKAQLKKWVANGEVQVLVGTHALISKGVFFENLGLVIIDEQHRFGKKQRAALRAKPQEKKRQEQKKTKIEKKGLSDNSEILPHLLSMTATPIPRTLALTIYGDLDLTVLDEMPPGRKKVETTLVEPSIEAREAAYEKIRLELQSGRQLYVICPRIFEADPKKQKSLLVKSAVAEAERLSKEVFPEYQIGVLHSKLKKDEKVSVMQDFADHKIDILVSTTVVEVGVNVPNATNIIIEGSERYGLSQLHQLRGRVIRSTFQPYCYLFADVKSETTAQRLDALTTAKNGFELAEYDLQFRGTGEMLGNKQSGVSDLAMEAIKNIKLVEAARTEASTIIKKSLLSKHPALTRRFKRLKETMYLE